MMGDQQPFDVEQGLSLAGLGPFHYKLLAVCGTALAADAVEMLAVGFILPSIDDMRLSNNEKGHLAAIVFVGMLLGSWFWGAFADRFGRALCLALALLTDASFGFASAFAPSFPVLLTFRMGSAIGVGGSIPVVFSYISEFVPSKGRQRFIIYLSMLWMVGCIYAASVGWAVLPLRFRLFHLSGEEYFNQWRLYLMLCSVPSALSSALFFNAYESPGFLYARGQTQHAFKTLVHVASSNSGKSAASCARSMRAKLFSVLRDPITASGVPVSPSASASNAVSTSDAGAETDDYPQGGDEEEYEQDREEEKHLVPRNVRQTITRGVGPRQSASSVPLPDPLRGALARTWALYKAPLTMQTTALTLVWFSISFGFYGLTLWMPEYFSMLPHLSIYTNSFIVALANIPGSLLALWLVPNLGPYWTIGLSAFVSSSSAFLLLAVRSGDAVVAMSCLFAATATSTWNSLNIVSAKAFPPEVRSTGFGVLAAWGRVGAIAGNLTFGRLLDIHPVLPVALTAVALLLGGILCVVLGVRRREHRESPVPSLQPSTTAAKRRNRHFSDDGL